MTERSVHVVVSGRVQGVWYRGNTREQAQSLGLRGWVRNLRDGRVEALLCGAEDRVASMLDWMRQGPAAARVDDLQVTDCDAPGEVDFVIRETR